MEKKVIGILLCFVLASFVVVSAEEMISSTSTEFTTTGLDLENPIGEDEPFENSRFGDNVIFALIIIILLIIFIYLYYSGKDKKEVQNKKLPLIESSSKKKSTKKVVKKTTKKAKK